MSAGRVSSGFTPSGPDHPNPRPPEGGFSTPPSGNVSSLIADLRAMHKGHVNNVHAGTHHDAARRRNLFSGCSCGWLGQERIADEYDATVPTPCPTVQRLDRFDAETAPARST